MLPPSKRAPHSPVLPLSDDEGEDARTVLSDRARPVPFSARRHLTPSAPMPSARPLPPSYRFDEGEEEQTRLMPAKNFSTLPPPPASAYELEVGAGPESAARPLRMRVHRPSTDLAPRPLPPPPARTDEHTSYRPSSTTTRPPPAMVSTQRSLGAPPAETASPTPAPVTYAPPTYASTPGEPMLPIMLQQPIVLGASSSLQQLTPDQIQAQIEAARSRQGHMMAAAAPQPWSMTQPPRAPDSGVIEVQGIAMSSPHLVVKTKRPASTWAVALVTMGLLGGLVAAVFARGDANGFMHSAMAYVEPAQAKASVASVGASTPASTPAAAAQPAAPTPEPQLQQPEPPPAPPAFDTVAKSDAKADKADKADKPEKSETKHERIARSSHASAPAVAPRPAPAPAPTPIAMPTPLADKPVAEKPLPAPAPAPVAVSDKPEKPSKSKKASKASAASDSDLESAAAADALAKAQLDQSLK